MGVEEFKFSSYKIYYLCIKKRLQAKIERHFSMGNQVLIKNLQIEEISSFLFLLQRLKRQIKRERKELMPLYRMVQEKIAKGAYENTLEFENQEAIFIESLLSSFLEQQKPEDRTGELYLNLISLKEKVQMGRRQEL